MKTVKTKLYQLNDLRVKNGKVDYCDLVGCLECWVGDLINQLENVDISHPGKSIENKNAVLVGIKLLALFAGMREL